MFCAQGGGDCLVKQCSLSAVMPGKTERVKARTPAADAAAMLFRVMGTFPRYVELN